MSVASGKTLLGIAFVAVAFAAAPQAAFAQACPTGGIVIGAGSVAAGGTASYSYTPDYTQMAHYWLDNVPGNLTMQVLDENQNIVCETPSSNTGSQMCVWQPAMGEVDTVNIMQPASQTAITAASGTASTTSAAATGNSANGLGGTMAAFNACALIIN
jgi:hypothetical protein